MTALPDVEPRWVIDEQDVFGVPRSAHCWSCGFFWERPSSDHQGETLPLVAAAHARTHSAAYEFKTLIQAATRRRRGGSH